MRLKKLSELFRTWSYASDIMDANVVLMRHGPRLATNDGDLSEEGEVLIRQYGKILAAIARLENALLACTAKKRTFDTLKLLFPFSSSEEYHRLPELDDNNVSKFVQKQVDELHIRIGRWRGYYMTHSYYFLEALGGVDSSGLHNMVAEKMKRRIENLFSFNKPVIYCGHSPQIEVGCERLLNISLAELGGFLNPLDSIHLRKNGEKIDFVARINPIVGYVDLEGEAFYKK